MTIFPSPHKGHILLTTNSQVMYGMAQRLDIDKLEHPLAVDQAGAYIEENGANLHRYPELYTKRRAHLLQTRGSLMADHPQSVTTTLSLSFEKVEQASEAARELLNCLAFLHPDAIPDELLEQGASQLGEQLQAVLTDALELESALGELRKYSLARRNPDGSTLTIHRLVQDVLKMMCFQRESLRPGRPADNISPKCKTV
jgi:hypothetical protein